MTRLIGLLEEEDSKLERSTYYDVEEVLRYLQAGVLYIVTPGLEDDRYNPDGKIRLERHILTDGTWAWPVSYAYYIRTYKVPVPVEFLKQISTNPIPFNVNIYDLAYHDQSD